MSVSAIPEALETADRSEPEPLRRPLPPPAPYPVDALGDVIGGACESLHRVIQAPPAICGASLLASASLAVQGLADVAIDDRAYPLSLWLLTVAESGERKSAVDGEAMRGAEAVERERHRAFRDDMADYNAQAEEYNAKKEAAKKKAKGGEGLADALRELDDTPEAPLLPTLKVADFTAEGLAKLLQNGRASVGAFTDEAGLVFGGHGMTKESVTRTAASLSKLWDKGEADRVRSGDGSMKLYGKRLALHLMAQPVIAERALSDAILSGQGFMARCLLAWPDGTAGVRLYRADSLRDDTALKRFTDRTEALLRKPLPLAEGARNEIEPPALTLTAKAKTRWIEVHNAIEKAEAPGGRYAVCKSWANKAPEQCLRIAGVLTLIETPEAQQIDADTIERAAEIALWHLDEAARLAGTAELSAEVRHAEALLNWCHETGRQALHSRAAMQYGPNCIRENATFTAAVDLLERTGWAYALEDGAKIDGKHRRRAWRIEPLCETMP